MAKIDSVIALVPFIESANIVPLGPALLKGILEANGCVTKTLDLNVQFLKLNNNEIINYLCNTNIELSSESLVIYESFIDQCVDQLLSFNSRWIGLSVFSYCSHIFTIDLLRAIRSRGTDVLITLGGSRLDMFKEELGGSFSDYVYYEGLADAINIGEGENTIIEIIKYNRKGIIRQAQLFNKDLENIPLPNFDDYTLTDYGDLDTLRLPVTATKGCVRDCTFCDVNLVWPKFRYRDGVSVANEMKHIRNKYGIKNFFFTDSLVNGGLKPFRALLEALSGTDIKWSGQFICRSERDMKPDMFDLMKASGCFKVSIGIESGSQKVRDDMKKNFTNEDLHYTAKQLLRVGILQSWNIMVGYPTETIDDFNETMTLLDHYKDEELITIYPVGLTSLISGTYLASDEYMEQMEITFNDNDDFLNWYSDKNPENTIQERMDRWELLMSLVNKHNLVREPHIRELINTKVEQLRIYKENKLR